MSKNLVDTSVYFGVDGKLSSTAAEHLTHVAKDLIANIQSSLSDISFVEKEIALIGESVNRTKVKYGTNYTQFKENLMENINKISQANAFIAWVREAVKTKEHMLEEISSISLKDWLKENKGIDFDYLELNKAIVDKQAADLKTEDDYFKGLNVKEMNRFLTVQARASVLGNLVHKQSSIRAALQDVIYAENNPAQQTGSGRDTVVTYSTTTASSDELQELLVGLQGTYREVEAQVNKIKYEKQQAAEEHNRKVRAWTIEEKAKLDEKRSLYQLELDNWKSIERERVGNLKIVIPEELKAFVDMLNEMSKANK